jgi:hypothetical protein
MTIANVSTRVLIDALVRRLGIAETCRRGWIAGIDGPAAARRRTRPTRVAEKERGDTELPCSPAACGGLLS